MGNEWKIHDTNFDNILYAMNSLFVIGSLEGWPDIMYACIDSNTSDIVIIFSKIHISFN